MNPTLYLRFPIALLVALLAGVLAAAEPKSEQTAHFFWDSIRCWKKLAGLQAQRVCGSTPTLEELAMRQLLLEAVQTATPDVDGVVAEISNEQGELSNLRTFLQSRRDSTVAKLNAAALITGSGVGAAVRATQFLPSGAGPTTLGTESGSAPASPPPSSP